MKLYYLALFCLLYALPGWTQQTCRSFDYRTQQLKADPSLAASVAAIEEFTARQIKERPVIVTGGTSGASSDASSGNAAPALITIPVVIHIVYNSSAENISDAQVQSQIAV